MHIDFADCNVAFGDDVEHVAGLIRADNVVCGECCVQFIEL